MLLLNRLPPSVANNCYLIGCVLWLLPSAGQVSAQQRYELRADRLGLTSTATRTGDSLSIVSASGELTVYQREVRFDSRDGRWLGYYSRSAGQILRWPLSDSGPMQIGSARAGVVEYRTSQMQVFAELGNQPREATPTLAPPLPARTAQKPVVPAQITAGSLLADLAVSKLFDLVTSRVGRSDPQLLRIASFDTRGIPWVLNRGRGFDVSCIRSGASSGTDWWVVPTGNGFVRVQTYDRGRVYSLAARRGGSLSLNPVAQDPSQLWRVTGAGRIRDRFLLENAAFGGNCLAHTGQGGVALQPITYLPQQLWTSYAAPVTPTFQPFWRTVSTEVVANSQLAPCQLELKNSHRYALITLLGDSRRGAEFEQIRIEPRTSQVIELQRDSGTTIVETVEILSIGGVWERQQYVTAVPPTALYDLSVYEEHLQSIAIDATGKSPNPIEDVNYVPKSVGWLPLPAELPASASIDLYPKAKAANNPGAVRRMDPRQFDDAPAADPLEDLLEKYQSVPRRKF